MANGIPQLGGSKVKSRALQGGTRSTSVDPRAAGVGTGNAQAAAQRLIGSAQGIAMEEYKKANETVHNAAALEAMKVKSDIEQKYMNVKGLNTVGIGAQAQKEVQKAMAEIEKRYVRNDDQRQMFSKTAVGIAETTYSTINQHAAKEYRAADMQNSEALATGYARDYVVAAEGDEDKHLADGVGVIEQLAARHGVGDEATARMVEKFKSDAISQRVLMDVVDRPEAARKTYQKNLLSIDPKVRPQLDREISKHENERKAYGQAIAITSQVQTEGEAIQLAREMGLKSGESPSMIEDTVDNIRMFYKDADNARKENVKNTWSNTYERLAKFQLKSKRVPKIRDLMTPQEYAQLPSEVKEDLDATLKGMRSEKRSAAAAYRAQFGFNKTQQDDAEDGAIAQAMVELTNSGQGPSDFIAQEWYVTLSAEGKLKVQQYVLAQEKAARAQVTAQARQHKAAKDLHGVNLTLNQETVAFVQGSPAWQALKKSKDAKDKARADAILGQTLRSVAQTEAEIKAKTGKPFVTPAERNQALSRAYRLASADYESAGFWKIDEEYTGIDRVEPDDIEALKVIDFDPEGADAEDALYIENVWRHNEVPDILTEEDQNHLVAVLRLAPDSFEEEFNKISKVKIKKAEQ